MRSLLMIFILLPIFLMSDNSIQPEYSTRLTVREIAEISEIPISKFLDLLELGDIDTGKTLNELEVTAVQLQEVISTYKKTRFNYFWGIVIVGMVIVFASLTLVGGIINQMKWLDKLHKFFGRRKNLSSTLENLFQDSTDNGANDIIAIVTAIYLHELDTKEKNNLLLTWKRSPLSFWKAAGKINMPNRIFFSGK